MNELQHHATAALAVLNRVQIALERIRAGHGSAALLPTIADQLRDAVLGKGGGDPLILQQDVALEVSPVGAAPL